MTPRIHIENVSKRFDETLALDDVSLSLDAGRALALIGPTAAGKTVLLKLVAGLYAPDGGRIEIDGAPLAPAHKARIGMLFQRNALFDGLPVWENIAFRLMVEGMPRARARAEAETLLGRVGLPVSAATLYPAELSGGMQKRVGFARAIATRPDILLLDNPTAGLDPVLAAHIDAVITETVRAYGATVISVTGNMAHLAEAYDDVAVLHKGVLRWHGSAAATATDPDPWLRQLLSGSRDGPIRTAA